MSKIEEMNEIPEMYFIKHKHDTRLPEMGFNYSDNLLKKTLSPIIYNNTNNDLFLTKLNDMTLAMIEDVLPVRNIFFHSLNKYYNQHGR